jgi:hypothetical protein
MGMGYLKPSNGSRINQKSSGDDGVHEGIGGLLRADAPAQPDAFPNDYNRFDTLGSTTLPSGKTTTKNICRSGPLIASEKHTSQNGTGVVRNS